MVFASRFSLHLLRVVGRLEVFHEGPCAHSSVGFSVLGSVRILCTSWVSWSAFGAVRLPYSVAGLFIPRMVSSEEHKFCVCGFVCYDTILSWMDVTEISTFLDHLNGNIDLDKHGFFFFFVLSICSFYGNSTCISLRGTSFPSPGQAPGVTVHDMWG